MNQADLWNQKGFDIIEHNIKTKNVKEVEDIKVMLEDFITLFSQPSVLEFGCGTGYYSEFIKPFVKSILGVDISSLGVEMTKKRGVDAIVGDIETMFFKHYDIVYGIAILHHTKHPMKNLMKACRIARKAVFFIEPNGSNPIRKFVERFIYPKESHECSFDTIELGRTMDSIKEFSWDIEPFSSYKSFFYPLIIFDKLINYLPMPMRMYIAQTFIIIGTRNRGMIL